MYIVVYSSFVNLYILEALSTGISASVLLIVFKNYFYFGNLVLSTK